MRYDMDGEFISYTKRHIFPLTSLIPIRARAEVFNILSEERNAEHIS